jgi:hypothetical protein
MSGLFPPDSTPSQGRKAGLSGNVGQEIVEAIFRGLRVPVVKNNAIYHLPTFDGRKDQVLIKQLYIKGSERVVDFFYIDFARKLRLPIEVKNQSRRGTVDEKLGYTINRLARSTEKHYWIVLFGHGWSPSVKRDCYKFIADLNATSRGRIIENHGSLLQDAIQSLVWQGKA